MASSGRRIRLGTISDRWSVSFMLFLLLLNIFSFLHCSARDDITAAEPLVDGETLVSAGGKFELGFFPPASSVSSYYGRYVGIWYKSDPSTIVWVANRDRPLLNDTRAVLAIKSRNLYVLDANGETYWRTNLDPSMSINTTAQLLDNGNLVLSDVKVRTTTRGSTIVWESFKNPTDTFIWGMTMDENLQLVSWKDQNDPAIGNFTFKKDEDDNQFVIQKGSKLHWLSKATGKLFPKDQMPPTMDSMVLPSSKSNDSIYYYKRVVMNYTGEIQYWGWDNNSRWTLIWNQPRDECSVFKACGDNGICNLKNDPKCDCLTGFKPDSPENWKAGDFSGGCVAAESKSCENSIFLNYTNMRVGKPDSQLHVEDETACRNECDCQCRAYSYDAAVTSTRNQGSNETCRIWRYDLSNLQEEYNGGLNLFVRVALSDEESTSKNCEACGTKIVSYPLSSGPNCGDPMYSRFQCNASTSQLSFNTSSGIYPVSSIDPDTQKFTILFKITDNCDARGSREIIKQLNDSLLPLPFTIATVCSRNPDDALSLRNGSEIEIGWDPPPEPPCNSSTDCQNWPSSTCSATENGNTRCICNENLKWDPKTLNCTLSTQVGGGYDGSDPKSNDTSRKRNQLIVILVIAIVIVSLFLCAIVYIWRRNAREREDSIQRNPVARRFDSERHAKNLIETSEFKEEDKHGIDVPFFEFESILVATDNFSDANKLGQGGYGPVYKGTFFGGQELAVKRLSSVSGQGLEEFKNEVVLIAKLQHRNLVKLWGYCVKGDEKILLYEYMPNRSLDAFVFDSKLAASLDWEMRFNIILGIARGLLYLHQDSRLRIIHRDMKTSNILLDEEMNPKISDFGLARIFGGKQNEANTNRVIGTYGYMAPEYALDGFFSVKSDVFSFGVVMLEIISGQRNTGFYRSQESLSLLGYAWRFWEEDDAVKLMDPTLADSCNISEFIKCMNVGLLCVQEEANVRPDMATVLVMLGSESSALPRPEQPAFMARSGPSSSGIASSSTGSKTEKRSDLTNTFVEGR